MTRTKPLVLVLYVAIGGAVGWLVQTALPVFGAGVVVPPVSLFVTLTAIGALVIVAAVPVRRAVRRRGSRPVDPFYATRVVVLAKASSIAGSLIFGIVVGLVFYLLTRTPIDRVGSIFASCAAIAGTVILVSCGLVAEKMCSIPPEDKDKDSGNGGRDPLTLPRR